MLAVFSPLGVVSGSAALNGCVQGPRGRLSAPAQKARNSTAPRELGFSRPFQAASTRQELPTAMVPPALVGARPPGNDRHIAD